MSTLSTKITTGKDYLYNLSRGAQQGLAGAAALVIVGGCAGGWAYSREVKTWTTFKEKALEDLQGLRARATAGWKGLTSSRAGQASIISGGALLTGTGAVATTLYLQKRPVTCSEGLGLISRSVLTPGAGYVKAGWMGLSGAAQRDLACIGALLMVGSGLAAWQLFDPKSFASAKKQVTSGAQAAYAKLTTGMTTLSTTTKVALGSTAALLAAGGGIATKLYLQNRPVTFYNGAQLVATAVSNCAQFIFTALASGAGQTKQLWIELTLPLKISVIVIGLLGTAIVTLATLLHSSRTIQQKLTAAANKNSQKLTGAQDERDQRVIELHKAYRNNQTLRDKVLLLEGNFEDQVSQLSDRAKQAIGFSDSDEPQPLSPEKIRSSLVAAVQYTLKLQNALNQQDITVNKVAAYGLTLQKQAKAFGEENVELKKAHERLTTENEKLKEGYKRVSEENVELVNQHQSSSLQTVTITQEKNKLDEAHKSLTSKHQEAINNLTQLTNKYNNLHTQLKQLTHQNQISSTVHDLMQQQVDKLQQSGEESQQQLTEAQKKIEVLTESNKQSQQQLAEAQQQVVVVTKSNEQDKQKLTEAAKQHLAHLTHTYQQEVEKFKLQITKLKKQVEKLQKQVEKLQKQPKSTGEESTVTSNDTNLNTITKKSAPSKQPPPPPKRPTTEEVTVE